MIIGNKQAIDLLLRVVEVNKISSAYLFTGISGVGKSLAAKYFIQKIFGCDAEKLANHPDLLWIKPEENKIKIDVIRTIPEFLSSSSMSASRSIVVIEDTHLMGEAAANALLKVLEEPGQATIILIADNTKSLLSTIVSRCQLVRFNRLNNLEIKQVLELLGYQIDDANILKMAEGSLGSAIHHWEMMQRIDADLLKSLTNPIKNIVNALTLGKRIGKEIKDKLDHVWLLNYLQLSCFANGNISVVNECEKSKKMIESNAQPRLVWECLLLKIIGK